MNMTLGLLTGIALLASSIAVHAKTPNLFELTGVPGSEIYRDTGYSAGALMDTDAMDDDATAFLFLEASNFAASNNFGIYGFESTDTGIVLGNHLEVFAGSLTPGVFFPTSTSLHFDLDAGTVTNSVTGDSANMENRFGFYLEIPEAGGQTYYSHASLNPSGIDHLLLFDTRDNSVGAFGGSDIVLAWEDGLGGGDLDYSNALIGITDVHPVSEPHGFALLLIALLGLACSRRFGSHRASLIRDA